MVQPALDAAELLDAEGLDCTVVNCRFLKPLDAAMLEALVAEHRTLVTVEEGTVVNGFGAYLAEPAPGPAPGGPRGRRSACPTGWSSRRPAPTSSSSSGSPPAASPAGSAPCTARRRVEAR